MEYLQFTEFRNHSKNYFDRIENGDEFIVIRRGKPIAQLIPFEGKKITWEKIKKVKPRRNIDTFSLLIAERNEK